MKIYIVQQDLHYEGCVNLTAHTSMAGAEESILEFVDRDLKEMRRLYPDHPERWVAEFYVIEEMELED